MPLHSAHLVVVLHIEQGGAAGEQLAIQGAAIFSEAQPTLLGPVAMASFLEMRAVSYEDARRQLFAELKCRGEHNQTWKRLYEMAIEADSHWSTV
jgi:RNA polymerase-interacting CarD/CdnL/TRCF family regulator